MKMKTRLKWIDTCKGIGIILVIIGHSIGDCKLRQWIYTFHMPLFFILTGILLYYSKYYDASFKTVFYKKIKSLLYPYLTFSILSIAYRCIFYGIKSGVFAFIHTITFDGITALWYLPALFLAEIIFIVISKELSNRFQAICFIFLFIIFYVFTTFDYQSRTGAIYWILYFLNILSRGVVGSIFIYLGFAGKKLFDKYHDRIHILAIIFFMTIGVLFSTANKVDLHYSVIGNPFIFLLCSISNSILVICISLVISKYDKLFNYLGKNSLVIFATHYNLGVVLFCSLVSSNLINDIVMCSIFNILAVLIIEIILSALINKYLLFLIKPNNVFREKA